MHNRKMLLLMIAGCVVPLAALAFLPLLKVSLGSGAFFLVVLLCPLLHLIMMGGMGAHGEHHGEHEKKTEIPSRKSLPAGNDRRLNSKVN